MQDGHAPPLTLSRGGFTLIVLWLLMVLVAQLRPIDDLDLFWQLQLGRDMLEHRQLVAHDTFTYTHHGDEVPTFHWLWQVVFAGLHQLGSWPITQLVNACCFAGAFAIAALSAPANMRKPFSLSCGVLLGFIAGLSQGSLRPQVVGLLGFAVILHLARCDWSWKRRVPAAVLTLLVWQNCHPSVLVALVPLSALMVANLRSPRWHWLALLLALVFLSQWATPVGTDALTWTRKNWEVSRELLRVSEWLPPWHDDVLAAMYGFWMALAVTIVLAVLVGRRIELAEGAVALAMTALALSSARFTLFWSVALVPIWVRWVELARPANTFSWSGEQPVSAHLGFAVFLLGLLAVGAFAHFAGVPRFAAEIPLRGVAELKERLPRGRVYNYREWSGPLIWTNSPNWQLAIDGRLYLFTRDEWVNYQDIALGRVPLEEFERRHRPDALFLRPTFHRAFIEQLRGSATWREVYRDDSCVVFVR